MRTDVLSNSKIAILATHGFEQSELQQPLDALEMAGAAVEVISPEAGTIRGWQGDDWGNDVPVDTTLGDADAEDFDALVLPGGVMNPDTLRARADATAFVREFFKEGKPVSAICHGPQILIDCGVLDGRELTSFPSIKLDLKNAGARWVDKAVVTDAGLTTSRTPDDLEAFIAKTIEEVREGAHPRNATA